MRKTLWENAPILAHDAVFIADSHYKGLDSEVLVFSESSTDSERLLQTQANASHNPSHNPPTNPSCALLETLRTLCECPSHELPSQIFLMGDIAHILVGALKPSREANAPLLEALQKLEAKTQIWWFEGNHDFCLAPLQALLPHTRFIPRTKQPMAFVLLDSEADSEQACATSESQATPRSISESSPSEYVKSTSAPSHKPLRLLLAHGDLFLNAKYESYIRTLTSAGGIFLLKILHYVTFGNLYRFLAKKINKKLIKEGRIDFEPFVKGRIECYMSWFHTQISQTHEEAQKSDESSEYTPFDGIIEGHFHLGKSTKENQILYISLPSFYVTRSIFTIKSALLNTK